MPSHTPKIYGKKLLNINNSNAIKAAISVIHVGKCVSHAPIKIK